jgi:hypothetical protein
MRPIIKGAIIAPQDWVENTFAVSPPVEFRLLPKNVPSVTNHAPQIKKLRNIINDNWMRVVDFMRRQNLKVS